MKSELIDTVDAISAFLDGLNDATSHLYVDLEGENLSRHGTLSLMTILVEAQKKVYLVDITTLQKAAFDTVGSRQQSRTLRGVLESPEIKKVFFDVRNDSDALYSLHGVSVAGVEDLQLMELASRSFNKKYVKGLAKCIERDCQIGYAEQKKWKEVKDKGRDLFAPERGGTYAVFDQRPLSDEMTDYCVQDVTFMPHLREIYRAKLCDAWWRKIETEVQARIRLSQSPNYNGKGPDKAMGPPGWIWWQPTAAERATRTLFGPSTPHTDGEVTSASPNGAIPGQSISDGLAEAMSKIQRLGLGERIHDPQSDSDDDEVVWGRTPN